MAERGVETGHYVCTLRHPLLGSIGNKDRHDDTGTIMMYNVLLLVGALGAGLALHGAEAQVGAGACIIAALQMTLLSRVAPRTGLAVRRGLDAVAT
jgi:hypothetical protein